MTDNDTAETDTTAAEQQADQPDEMSEKGGAERDDSRLNLVFQADDPGHRVMIAAMRDAGISVEASLLNQDAVQEVLREEIYAIYSDVLAEAEAAQQAQAQQAQPQQPQQPPQPAQQPPRDEEDNEEG